MYKNLVFIKFINILCNSYRFLHLRQFLVVDLRQLSLLNFVQLSWLVSVQLPISSSTSLNLFAKMSVSRDDSMVLYPLMILNLDKVKGDVNKYHTFTFTKVIKLLSKHAFEMVWVQLLSLQDLLLVLLLWVLQNRNFFWVYLDFPAYSGHSWIPIRRIFLRYRPEVDPGFCRIWIRVKKIPTM